ncbi:MAG TPA: proton-conducting transporter membrane subunit [Planctomycetota bacterium]|nr:proton-conducting transporter membrane subunit [Planctomycetota bacterium]
MTTGLGLVLAGALVWALSGAPVVVMAQRRRPAERLAALLASGGSLLGGIGALLGVIGPADAAVSGWSLPGLSLAVELDGLSALFLLPVFLVSGLGAIYGLGYDASFGARGRLIRVFQGLLTAGMCVLVLARNGMLFLIGWEIMALAAFFLIATEHDKVQPRRAAWVYLVTAHFCTLCLVAVMVLLQTPDGSLDWQPDSIATLSSPRTIVVFAFALAGFGLKAGVMPLHVWLPGAHGNAPSHVSAVLSGVMLQMGVYGLLRLLSMLPPLPAACGVIVVVLGAVSALLGIAATFAQGDLKRLLAYSSIENLGIVLLGVGLAMLGRSLGDGKLVVLGLGGALFHGWNHSLFKPLLFFGAGSVMHATGTRDLDQLGGLGRVMRRTAVCFLVGAAAISGLPLLNGFASELVLYMGLFTAATRPETMVAMLAAAVLGAMAMVGGLAVATFARTNATVFLGRARSAASAHAHESPPSMTVPAVVLAALCLLIGQAPWLCAPLLDGAIAAFARHAAPHSTPDSIAALVPFGMLSAVSLGVTLPLVGCVLWLTSVHRRRRAQVAAVGTWDCGFVDASAPRLQYTGSSFAAFTARILDWTVRERTQPPAPLELFPGPRAFVRRTVEPLLHGVLWPLAHRIADRCSRLRILQRGKLQIYLLYMLVVLVALLTWSVFAT